jgi:hypothetical protein
VLHLPRRHGCCVEREVGPHLPARSGERPCHGELLLHDSSRRHPRSPRPTSSPGDQPPRGAATATIRTPPAARARASRSPPLDPRAASRGSPVLGSPGIAATRPHHLAERTTTRSAEYQLCLKCHSGYPTAQQPQRQALARQARRGRRVQPTTPSPPARPPAATRRRRWP